VIDRQRLIITFVTNLRGPDAPALVHARVGEVARVTTTVGNVPVVFAALCYAGTLRLTDPDPDPDACRSWTNALVPHLRQRWTRSARRHPQVLIDASHPKLASACGT
jgi:hypothetical protein